MLHIWLTWVSRSRDILEQFLHANPVRLGLPRQADSCWEVFFDHSQEKGQHDHSPGSWKSHLQSSWLDLQVLQWQRQLTLMHTSWTERNNIAPRMNRATTMTAPNTLYDNKREQGCSLNHVSSQGCMFNGIPALLPSSAKSNKISNFWTPHVIHWTYTYRSDITTYTKIIRNWIPQWRDVKTFSSPILFSLCSEPKGWVWNS